MQDFLKIVLELFKTVKTAVLCVLKEFGVLKIYVIYLHICYILARNSRNKNTIVGKLVS